VSLNIAEFRGFVYFFAAKSKGIYILITFVITMCTLTACNRKNDDETPPSENPNLPVANNLDKADELFKQREDIEKLREARKLIAAVRQPDHRNFDVEWKFAKLSLFLGDKLTDDDQKEKTFEEGRDAGKIASRIQPDKPDGFFWYGANLAELAKLSPITVGLTSLDDIREAMNTVIRLQPDYQGASAYDILAQVELNTLMSGGKAPKAEEYLQKAIALEKNNSNLRLHLAQAYLDDDKLDLAKQQLEYIVKMQPDPEYLPEHKENVIEAKKLLASRF
jgi:tetratricopeptide (TPR) repeat protein